MLIDCVCAFDMRGGRFLFADQSVQGVRAVCLLRG